MKIKLLFILFFLACFQTACDKACRKTVEDYTVIENLTGRDIQFRVCKKTAHSTEMQMLDVSVKSVSVPQTVAIGNHMEYEIKGGPQISSCENKTETSDLAVIMLSPSGFASFKLCYDDVRKRSIIIEKYQVCPTGALEQTAPGDCAAP